MTRNDERLVTYPDAMRRMVVHCQEIGRLVAGVLPGIEHLQTEHQREIMANMVEVEWTLRELRKHISKATVMMEIDGLVP